MRVFFSDIGRELDIPCGEEIPGMPVGMNIKWEPEHIPAVVEKVRNLLVQEKAVAFSGHVSSWMLAAATAAVTPSPVIFHLSNEEVEDIKSLCGIAELDPDQLIPELSIGEPTPDGKLNFVIEKETEDRIYMRFEIDTSDGRSSHSFVAKDLLKVVLPKIALGKDLFIYGSGPNFIPAAICLGYMKIARSISFRYHSDPFFACAVSKALDRPVGYAEKLSEEDSKRFTDDDMPPDGMPEIEGSRQNPLEFPGKMASQDRNDTERQSFPRSVVFNSITWPLKYYELNGTYKVMMLDHMPGGAAEGHSEVPVATARFKTENGKLIGTYDEPGRELVELENVYCDGLNCGWIRPDIHPIIDKGTELFKFELIMHHDNILLGNCGSSFKPSPVACIQIKDKVEPKQGDHMQFPNAPTEGGLPPSPMEEEIERPDFPRDKCFDDIIWPETYYTLEGSYRVLMLDHMPGGAAEGHSEVPVATARFKTENGKLIGTYDEPGRELVELENVYCDGLTCGWIHPDIHPIIDRGTEVFKFELTMNHDNILLGDCGCDSKPSPIACIQIKE